ncbi:MAG: hypothetical protein Q8K63_13750, partial [Acidimicrobiales bacterium]|nr:hypothetical protein [Acidimicrobiales bacterium]
EHDHEPLVAAAKVSKHDEALYMLRHLWSYEGHDLAEGVRQVEKYCRTVERRMRAAEFGRTTD